MTSYDDAFFRYVSESAKRSARNLLPILLREITVPSILDVGCGQGAWLSVWRELGVRDVVGLDGSYVDTDRLLIPRDCFLPHDLRAGFDLNRRFAVVQSLEVAEHLPASCGPGFVAALVRHGDLILFSAAPKGQGGHGHVNEQSYDYWRALFAYHGYCAVDFLRPRLVGVTSVAPWYRFNTLLYASEAAFERLPEVVQVARVPDGRPIEDLAPFSYRARRLATRLLPPAMATLIARVKERATIAIASRHERGRK
jgi:SAM-dependent methyltransferase